MKYNILKWYQTIVVSFAKHTAYRLDFFLQIIAPVVVFFFINYSLWSSIYKNNFNIIIQGYNFNQMIQYHSWVMIVGLISQGHTSFNLAQDIRLGKISTYLIYPFNLWEFHTASFLSFQLIQLFISCISLLCLVQINLIQISSYTLLIKGFTVCLCVSLLWYTVQYFLGLLSFWLDETWILRVTFRLLASFLSGIILPLSFFPEKVLELIKLTPFPYMTYYPIKILMGQDNLFWDCITVLSIWTVIFYFLSVLVWKKGLKLYTAAGM